MAIFSSIDGLKGSALFQWFNLTPAGEGLYRPEGEAFRAQVSLAVEAGDGGELQALTLRVARAMIDDPRQGMFGRDIVKSFLEAVSGSDRTLAGLIDEIFHRDTLGPVLTAATPSALPEESSAGFLTVTGALPSWSATLRRVEVERRAAPRRFFARLFG